MDSLKGNMEDKFTANNPSKVLFYHKVFTSVMYSSWESLHMGIFKYQ